MTKIPISALCMGLLMGPTPPAAQDKSANCQWTDAWTVLGSGWSRYTNERFGTIAEVPRHLFELGDPPANGDGRALKSKDGAQLSIFASYSPYVVTDTFEGYKKWLLDNEREEGRRVTYKAEGKNWIAFSGADGANIFYERVIEGCGAAHTFSIVYPASKKALYDPIVTRVSRSLSCQNRPLQNNLFGLKSCPRE